MLKHVEKIASLILVMALLVGIFHIGIPTAEDDVAVSNASLSGESSCNNKIDSTDFTSQDESIQQQLNEDVIYGISSNNQNAENLTSTNLNYIDEPKSDSQQIQEINPLNSRKDESFVEHNEVLVKTLDKSLLKKEKTRHLFGDWYLITCEDAAETKEKTEYFQSLSAVEKAEQNRECVLTDADEEVPNEDLNYGNDLIGAVAGKNAIIEKYGTISDAPQVVVGIIDSGIDEAHPMFKNRLLPKNKGVKYNFIYGEDIQSVYDDTGHGTHVAGIIVGATAENVKLRSYKIFKEGDDAGTAGIAEAIHTAVDDGVDVINMSLASYYRSVIIEEALKKAYDAGVVVCVSAGNDSNLSDAYVLTESQYTLSFTSINQSSNFSNFSSFGYNVDFCAPGEGIISAEAGGETTEKSGTSMAAPFGSACCATILSLQSDCSFETVATTLKNNAVDLGDSGWDMKYGHGLVNLNNIEIIPAAQMPKLSQESGYYPEGLQLVLSHANSFADIRYSTDGSFPTSDSLKYTKPLNLQSSVYLNIVAFEEGLTESWPVIKRYATDNGVIEQDFYSRRPGAINQYIGMTPSFYIPESLFGVPITFLEDDVLRKNSFVEKVYISNRIEEITSESLLGCNAKYFYIGDLVKNIDPYSLPCKPDIEVEVSEKNKNFKIIGNALYHMKNGKPHALVKYLFKAEARQVTVPDTVKYIYYGAFEQRTFPETETKLKTIYLGAGVEKLNLSLAIDNEMTFVDFDRANVIVSEDNPYFCSENGILFNKEKSVLYYRCRSAPGERVVLPDTVREIDNWAFRNNTMKEIVLNHGLKTIGQNAFIYCDNVSSITIPSTVTLLEQEALYINNDKPDVYFLGDAPRANEESETYNNTLLSDNIYIHKDAEGFDKECWDDYRDIIKVVDNLDYSKGYIEHPVENGTLKFCEASGTINGYTGNIETVEIPDEINGVPVVSVGFEAFCNCDTLKNIVFGKNLKEIERRAFLDCDNLENVVIPGNIKRIRRWAFSNAGIKTLEIQEGTEILEDYTFADLTRLEYYGVKLADSIKEIGRTVFAGEIMKEFYLPKLPESLVLAKRGAFVTAKFKDDTVLMPKNLEYTDSFVFAMDGPYSRGNITVVVPEGVPVFSRSIEAKQCTFVYQGDVYDEMATFGVFAEYKHLVSKDAKVNESLSPFCEAIEREDIADYFPGHVHEFNEEYAHNGDNHYGYDGTETSGMCTKPGCNETSTREAEHKYSAIILDGYVNIADDYDGTSKADFYKVCELCGVIGKEVFKSNLTFVYEPCVHRYSEFEITAEPNCSVTGAKCRNCQICSAVDWVILEKDPDRHNGDTVLLNFEPSSCISYGYTGDLCCADCGFVLEKGTVVKDFLKHSYTEWKTKRPATCTTKGLKQRSCWNCGHTETVETAIFKGNHQGGQKTLPEIPPTCGKDGMTQRTVCGGCGEVFYGGDLIEKNEEHNFVYVASKGVKKATPYEDGYYYTHCNVCGISSGEKYKINKVSDVKIHYIEYTGNTPKYLIAVWQGDYVIHKTYYTVEFGSNKIGATQLKITLGRMHTGTILKNVTITPPKVKGVKTTAGQGSVTVKWKKNNHCDGYRITLVKGKTTKKIIVKGKSTLKKTIYDLKKGTYKVTVDAYKTVKGKRVYTSRADESKVKISKSAPKPPTKVKSFKCTAGKGLLKLSWKKVKDADGYQVYITKRNYKKSFYVKGAGNLKKTVKGLKKGTYTIKVRAYKKVEGRTIYGKYSATVKKKIKSYK